MIRNYAPAASALLILLGACGEKPAGSGEEKARAPVPAPAPAAVIEPGQWESTSEVVEMAMPGMPAEMTKGMIGRKTSFSNCITPEQAAKNPSDLLVQDSPGGAKCTRDHFSMAGGKMEAAMTCTGGEMPGTIHMEIAGQYKPAAYETTVTMTTQAPPGAPDGGTMRMVSRTTAKRVGDCTAQAPAAPAKPGQPG